MFANSKVVTQVTAKIERRFKHDSTGRLLLSSSSYEKTLELIYDLNNWIMISIIDLWSLWSTNDWLWWYISMIYFNNWFMYNYWDHKYLLLRPYLCNWDHNISTMDHTWCPSHKRSPVKCTVFCRRVYVWRVSRMVHRIIHSPDGLTEWKQKSILHSKKSIMNHVSLLT